MASLADYEAYRERLAADPVSRGNCAFAKAKRAILLREDRLLLKLASGSHAKVLTS